MGQMTEKQGALLQKHHWYNDGISYEEASRRIDAIKNNGWKKPTSGGGGSRPATAPARGTTPGRPGRVIPAQAGTQPGEPTERQVALLVKFSYEPSEYTFETASALIDELRANEWKPLNDSGDVDGGDAYRDDIPF